MCVFRAESGVSPPDAATERLRLLRNSPWALETSIAPTSPSGILIQNGKVGAATTFAPRLFEFRRKDRLRPLSDAMSRFSSIATPFRIFKTPPASPPGGLTRTELRRRATDSELASYSRFRKSDLSYPFPLPRSLSLSLI